MFPPPIWFPIYDQTLAMLIDVPQNEMLRHKRDMRWALRTQFDSESPEPAFEEYSIVIVD